MKAGKVAGKAVRRKLGGSVRDPVALRRAVLDNALQLFESRGYHETSVEDIVKRGGFTKGALYHHFASKEDILREIQMEYIENRVLNANQIMERYSAPQDRIRNLIVEALSGIDQFRAHVAVFLQERRFLSAASFSAVKKRRDELERIYLAVITQGMEEGVFSRNIQPKIASFAILGVLSGAYSWYSPSGKLSAAEVAGQLYLMIVNGLRSRLPEKETVT